MSPDLAPGNIRSRTVGKRVPDKEVLERLANAQEIYRREDFQDIRARVQRKCHDYFCEVIV
jgi:hypothetical protein